MTINSASCSLLRRFDKNGYDYGQWEITASGTASGSVGTQVEMPNWLGYKNYTATVSWTKVFGAFARRDQGQPYTTNYSIRFTIESNYNPGYGINDRLGASISGPNAYTVFVNVACPAP